MNGAGLGLVGLVLAIIDFFGASAVLERWLATGPARVKSLMPWHADRPQTSFDWWARTMPLALIGGIVMGAIGCILIPNPPGEAPLMSAALNFTIGSILAVFFVHCAVTAIALYARIWLALLAEGKSALDRILLSFLVLVATPFFLPMGVVMGVIGLEILVVGLLFSLLVKLRIPKPLACVGLTLGGVSLVPFDFPMGH
ncbi:MAG: hypothetical protein ABL956_18665 [Hyphomonadaceae bacterium]